MQRITESSCVRKETVDIKILKTSRNGDRKIMQSQNNEWVFHENKKFEKIHRMKQDF